MSNQVDLDDDDLQRSPWLYPGTPPPSSGLLRGADFVGLAPKEHRRLGQALVEGFGGDRGSCLNEALLRANATPVDKRHVVVAVGSNASLAVMRRKFHNGRVSTVVPFVSARVQGLGIGHSAHVSPAGYIAAAPYRDPGADSEVYVLFLSGRQLACLDESEPNYVRCRVDSAECQLTLEGGERPDAFLVYVSKWGILTREDGTMFPVLDQSALFEELRASCAPFTELVGGGGPEAVMTRLADDGELRDRATAAFEHAGRATPAGFEPTDASPTAEYGRIPSAWEELDVAGAFVCRPTPDDLDRRGEQCVTLHPDDLQQLGNPTHIGVTGVQSPELAPAPARVLRGSTDQARGTAGVDQVLRNALGTELWEHVRLTKIEVISTPIADRLLYRPHFAMARVQAADLATVEQNIGLVSPLTLGILGVQDGDEVIVQGAPDEDGKVADVCIRVHVAPAEMIELRQEISGGSLSTRFPSARDALGVFPDLPWIFLDSASRSKLRLDGKRLSAVRIRSSRTFQVNRELREVMLVLVLAFLGFATLVKSKWVLAALFGVLFVVVGAVMRSRLRRRLGG